MTSFPYNGSNSFSNQNKTWYLVRKWCGPGLLFRGYKILAGVLLHLRFVNFPSFLDNSSNSFHPFKIKLGRDLDYELEQRILFQGYSQPDISGIILPKIFVNMTSFPDNGSYSFHQIKMKPEKYLTMLWSNAYYFKVTVCQILAELFWIRD